MLIENELSTTLKNMNDVNYYKYFYRWKIHLKNRFQS